MRIIGPALEMVHAARGIGAASAREPVRIGVLTDMSNGFSACSGNGSVHAAQMAAKDVAKANPKACFKVEVISVDHQNKADIASSVTQRWLSEAVNAIAHVPNSAAALAVNFAPPDSKTGFLVSGGGHDSLTGKESSLVK
jgi:branched-chain amino acid transport system substrate-binding protein